jgi:hypothetical protein
MRKVDKVDNVDRFDKDKGAEKDEVLIIIYELGSRELSICLLLND